MRAPYDDYMAFLNNIFWQRLIVGIVLFIVLFSIIIFLFVRKEHLELKIVLISLEVLVIVVTFFSVLPYGYDIYNNGYVTYQGQYTVQDIVAEKGNGFFAIIFLNDSKTTLKLYLKVCAEDPPIGCHEGSLIYSRSTKLLFEWE